MAPETKPQPDLLERTKNFVAEVLADFLKRPIEIVAGRIASTVARYMLALTFVCAAVVFLLIGLVLLLQKAGADPYVSYLAAGGVSLLLGGIVLMRKPNR